MKRQWGTRGEELYRYLSARKVKRIKKGLDVTIKVNGQIVILTSKKTNCRIEKKIANLEAKIKALKAQGEIK